MRLEAVDRLAASVSRPSGLAILMTSGGDHRRIDQRAGLDLYGLCLELARDFIEELLIQAVSQQLLTEPDEGCALWGRLGLGKPAEPPERRSILQSLGKLHVGQVVPHCDQQSLEQGQRWPGWLALGSAMDRVEQ